MESGALQNKSCSITVVVYSFIITVVLFAVLFLDLIPPDLLLAMRPTQPSILPRSVNEYQIIPRQILSHRRCGLLPSTTTGGMTDA